MKYARITGLCLAAALLAILASGCGLLGGGVAKRAADYYSLQLGQLPNGSYSSFLSPSYRTMADPQGLSEIDTAYRMRKPSKVTKRLSTSQVAVNTEGRFAYTTADASLGREFADGNPVRWVKDGMQWYLYFGSSSEIGKYGEFPATLTPPPAPSGGEEQGSGDVPAEPGQEGDGQPVR